MARYEGAWGRGGLGSYDQRSFRYPSAYGRGESGGGNGRWQNDRGSFGGGEEWGGSFGEGIYGPGRYGLGPYHDRLRRHRRPDQELKTEVEEALFYDTWVDAEAITVDVRDGVVVLRGELPNYEEIRYATDDAWDVDGVVGVRSELTVRQR